MKMRWSIKIISCDNLSENKRELIIDLIDNEAHKATKKNQFILHDVFEETNLSELIVEGQKEAVDNLLLMLKSNLRYNISYKKIF